MAPILGDTGMPSNAHRVDETFHRGKRPDTARCTERSASLSFRLLRVPPVFQSAWFPAAKRCV